MYVLQQSNYWGYCARPKLRTRNGRTEDSDDSEWASVQTMQDTGVGVDVQSQGGASSMGPEIKGLHS